MMTNNLLIKITKMKLEFIYKSKFSNQYYIVLENKHGSHLSIKVNEYEALTLIRLSKLKPEIPDDESFTFWT